MYKPGASNDSNMISAIFSRLIAGLKGASVLGKVYYFTEWLIFPKKEVMQRFWNCSNQAIKSIWSLCCTYSITGRSRVSTLRWFSNVCSQINCISSQLVTMPCSVHSVTFLWTEIFSRIYIVICYLLDMRETGFLALLVPHHPHSDRVAPIANWVTCPYTSCIFCTILWWTTYRCGEDCLVTNSSNNGRENDTGF